MKNGSKLPAEILYFRPVQIKNALSEVYDIDQILYKNDLWHVEKNVKNNWNRD